MVACTAVWHVADPDSARRALDSHFRTDGDGWIETHVLGGNDPIIRAQLRLEDDRLNVSTLSEARMDRLLDYLEASVPGRLLSDERAPMIDGAEAERRQVPGTDAVDQTADDPVRDLHPATLSELKSQIQEQMEDRWMREPVPALAGLTPRQAAADPTRREQLERLLASFEERGPAPEGVFTFRVERLRRELGV
jgi:hypothetical protein